MIMNVLRRTAPPLLVGMLAASAALGTAAPAAAIHEGTGASTDDVPWMAAITDAGGTQFCGGTVIDEAWVLTAAHCVVERPSRTLRVVVGRTDLRTDEGLVRKITEVHVHPRYVEVAMGVDIALLRLKKPVGVPTLGLPTKQKPALEPGVLADVYGWGRTEQEPTGSPLLRTTELELAELDECAPYAQPEEKSAQRLCGLPPGGGDESICPGDSGGPLVVGSRVVGVVSTGNKFCDDQLPLSVFARVSAGTKWIKELAGAGG